MSLTTKGIKRCFLTVLILGVLLMCSSVVAHGAVMDPTAKGYVFDEEGVNLRSSYSTSSSIVAGIPGGATVTVIREKFTSSTSSALDKRWFYVNSSYGNGYIRSDLLDITFSPIDHVTTTDVNVRTGPGTGFSHAATFEKGRSVPVRLKVYSSNGETWYKVTYNSKSYYVYGEYLTRPVSATNRDFEAELAEFPSSYHSYLKALHSKYPAWHFEAKKLTYSWDEALKKQISNPGTNTVLYNYLPAYAYRDVSEDTYDFEKGEYITYDSGGYVSASKSAVAYFMDPRNWLDEYSVFMFEKLKYDENTQLKSTVESILEGTKIPVARASSYMQAAEDYDVSPVYLAAKSKVELGNYDTMISGGSFTYQGKTYKGYYNAYNIGAYRTDSATAVENGLNFARTVDDYYLGPWDTLDKAIRGGAKFIAEDFVGNNQHTIYYQHFNVANGLNEVGTHPYMTAIYGPYNEAWMQGTDYHDSGLIDSAFTFEIPVYKSMPSSPASEPPKGNNNNYLDSLKVYEDSAVKTLNKSFSRFTSTYDAKYAVKTNDVTVKAVTNDKDATVTVTGSKNLKIGENKITVKVKSSSGLTRYYYVNLIKAPTVSISNSASSGKPVLTWEKDPKAVEYKVYRSTSENGTYTLLKTLTGNQYTNTDAVTGVEYYYKVKAVYDDGIVEEATSKVVCRVCDLPRPVVTAGNNAENGNVKLTWKAVEGAKVYEVYRATSESGSYTKMTATTNTTYTNTSGDRDKTYYYKVKAIHENSYADSAYSEVQSRVRDLPRPVVTASNNAETGNVKLTWKAVEGAEAYEVYRATSESGSYTKMTATTNTTYTNTSGDRGKTYYYKVKAIHENSYADSAYSVVQSRVRDLPRPVVSAGNNATTGKVKLTWKAVEGAEAYEIYRAASESGSYTKMYSTKSTSYTNTSGIAGNTYYYKVKAIHENRSADSAYSSIVKGTVF